MDRGQVINRQQILRDLQAHQDEVRAFGVRRLGLFGSHVRGEARPDSDVDLLVEFEPGAKSFDAYMDLKAFLEELFGCRVDLVIAEVLKPRLRDVILREAVYTAQILAEP